jgi:hypothetical protein
MARAAPIRGVALAARGPLSWRTEVRVDWTFWVGAGVLAAVWILTQWALSERRFARRVRMLDPEQAKAIMEAEEDRRELKFWFR